MQALLDVRNLSVSFGRQKAVNGLDMTIAPNEVLAVVGESGCGKSVTANAIMGLLPDSARIEGEIFFAGTDILKKPTEWRRDLLGKEISMIFQDPMTSLNPVMTVGDQIVEAIRLHENVSYRMARGRVVELLDLVRLRDPHLVVDEYPHRLSGGMRQRVMIAMAVSMQPKLLIADEPTTALDVTVQAQIFDLLDRLRAELSMAVMLITHDIGVVAEQADQVMVMYAGSAAEYAPVATILGTPVHPYTQGLIGASLGHLGDLHYTTTRLADIPGNVISSRDVTGCRFAPRCHAALQSCMTQRPVPRPYAEGHAVACDVRNPLRKGAA